MLKTEIDEQAKALQTWLLEWSIKTVEKHRGSLMSKLAVRSVAELMARALKDGLIDPI